MNPEPTSTAAIAYAVAAGHVTVTRIAAAMGVDPRDQRLRDTISGMLTAGFLLAGQDNTLRLADPTPYQCVTPAAQPAGVSPTAAAGADDVDDEVEEEEPEEDWDDQVLPDPGDVYRRAAIGNVGQILMTGEYGLAALVIGRDDDEPVVLSNMLNDLDLQQLAKDIRGVLRQMDGGAKVALGRVRSVDDDGEEQIEVCGRVLPNGPPLVFFTKGRCIATLSLDDARLAAKAADAIARVQAEYDENNPTNSAELPAGHTVRRKGRTKIDEDENDYGVVGVLVDTPDGPRARLAMVDYGNHAGYSGGRSPAAVELDAATVDAVQAALDEFDRAGAAHTADFDRRQAEIDGFWDEFSDLQARHGRWARGVDEGAKLSDDEQARMAELDRREDQIWADFDPEAPVGGEVRIPAGWGTLVMRARGGDWGDGGWAVQLAVQPDDDHGWQWGWGSDTHGWKMPLGELPEPGRRKFRQWLKSARQAIA